MAETVKKSRIVSETECPSDLIEESSLQEIINEEFNQRLKSCMNEVGTVETNAKQNGNAQRADTHNGQSTNNDTPNPETNDNETTAKDRFLDESASAKDRMFLSTDSACLLFTQTVQSPMLTPTDENYDFLQALRRDSDMNAAKGPPAETEIVPDNMEVLAAEPQPEHSVEKVLNDETEPYHNQQILEPVQMSNIPELIVESIPKYGDFVPDNDELVGASCTASDTVENKPGTSETDGEVIHRPNGDSQVESPVKESPVASPLKESPDVIRIETADRRPMRFENGSPIINYDINFDDSEVEIIEKSPDAQTKSPSRISEISKIFRDAPDPEPEAETKLPSPSLSLSPSPSPSPPPKRPPHRSEMFEAVRRTKELFERKRHIPEPVTNVCANSFSKTTMSESTVVQTMVEDKGQEKALKKKKSKKSKKDSEKENISVCESPLAGDEESLSHVSVKNLCRSFSDLTDIGSRAACSYLKVDTPYGRTRSMSDIDCGSEIHTGVSVKALKSSFSKFDALSKKTVLHVRSSDSSKAQEKFNGSSQADMSNCKACGKVVFQMEQMKAEKAVWHKNCFRCTECSKQLAVDTYQSNEGALYCKPHFKALFTPKAVEENKPVRPRKHELIIRENQPQELPPDVIRASDKPDLGLEELQNLNVKERFQLFQQQENENSLERTPSTVNVKRSASILSKLAKFQLRGMDVGVADDALNGIPVEDSSTEEEEEEDDGIEGEDAELIRAKRQQREKPLHFNNMSDIMSKWESGNQMNKEERREERKQEIQSFRSRIFMGKQGKMKELYQQAVADSESGANVKKHVATEICENAKSIKERFERGEPLTRDEEQKLGEEDMSVFESGISRKSRSIFLELDANASKAPQMVPVSPSKSIGDVRKAREAFTCRQSSEDVVRASDHVDDVTIRTADISNRFKFFEAYKEPEKQKKAFRITPPRDGQLKEPSPETQIYRDPDVVRSEETVDDSEVVQKSHTATKMLSIFRQMEENLCKEPVPAGPKPLKRFTPPPEPARDSSDDCSEAETDDDDDDEEEDEEEEDSEHGDRPRIQDGDLLEAQKAARAKQLRAKFERWEADEMQREQNNSSVNIAEEFGDEQSQIESAKSLRARFESMREPASEKERAPRVKVNRFVDTTNTVDTCKGCAGRVYPLEKVSCHSAVYHRNCFRCRECNAVLRMDSFSYNQGLLYCTPHFKRLFIAKGDYESAFGLSQPKAKWNSLP